MKLLCVADQIDPAIYSTTFKEKFKEIDAVLCAGDLPMDYIDFIVTTLNKPAYFIFGNHNLNEFKFYHKPAHQLQTPAPHTFDESNSISHFHGADYIGFKVTKVPQLVIPHPVTGTPTPLLIAGVSGSLRYNNGINQYTEKEMKLHLLKMWPQLYLNKLKYGRYLDIFLTHAAPRHIHDLEDPCHKGFECFNWFISKFQPQYFIHGHIHLYDLRTERVTKSNQTTVINAFGYHVIEIQTT
ncbi:MAG: metallophosphoesterase [Treponema sp.]|nr:metallophosphoesterase [Treponema sp.]